jgi:DNA-binding CsgD family transcriptional regulator
LAVPGTRRDSMDASTHSIIAGFYRAASGVHAWADAFDPVVQRLQLLGCQMIGLDVASRAIRFSHASHDMVAEGELEYIRGYHALDPRVPFLLGSAPGEFFYCQDHFDDAMVQDNPYYRDLLIAFGGRYSACAKLVASEHEVVLIGFLTRLGLGKITPEQQRWLEEIAPHLCEAVKIYRRPRALAADALMAQQLLERFPRPALLLHPDRRLSLANRAGMRLLDSGTPFFLSNGRIVALDSDIDAAFGEAMHLLVHGEARMGGRTALRLARQRRAPVALSLTLFVPEASLHAFGDQTQILAMAHSTTPGMAPDLMLWQAAFDLTRAQARVAAEIYAGKSIRDAAASLMVSEATARSHLKEVFAKTATHRQPELVAVLSSLSS